MAIDARCPFCSKPYRLKDDLVGRKVTCANQECRKVFAVAPIVAVPQDADAIAAQALSDEVPVVEPVESRAIAMTCVICDHKWSAAWDMQGKNVLCPDCKHRQKVPEQKLNKPRNWADTSNVPSMAKIDKLEGVTSARDTSMVSGDTLLKTGVIDDGVEPMALKTKLMFASAALALLFVFAGTGWYFFIYRTRNRGEEMVVTGFVDAADSEEFKPLPLHRALLRMAGGEYAARKNDPEQLTLAIGIYSKALGDLSAAPKGADRDCLTGELALSMLNLGSADTLLLTDKKKIPWLPEPPKNGRAQVRNNRAEEEGVLGQLRRVLQALQSNKADLEIRAWTARRLARELIARKQIDVLRSNVSHGFSEAETPEIMGQIGLELLRADQKEEAKAMAENLLKTPANLNSPSVLALADALELKPIAPEPGGAFSERSRMAFTASHLMKKNYPEAMKDASRPGTTDVRVRALALGAEWATEPAAFLDAAEKIVNDVSSKPIDGNTAISVYPLLRLAVIAARHGERDKAAHFAKAIADVPLRTYAEAEILHQILLADRRREASEGEAPLPEALNAKDFLLGFAWGRYQLARHNGFNDSARLAKQYAETWPKPLAAPFGAAGAMLGVQDRAVNP